MKARRAALAAAILALVHTQGAAAQGVVQRPQGNITVPGVSPDIPSGTAPTSPDMPDERPLWRLLSTGDDKTLEERIARLRAAYPAWTPPPEILALLARRNDERAFTQAKAQKDWPTVRRLAAAHPEMVACSRPDDAAAAAAGPGAPSTLAQVFASCLDDASRAALLGSALDRFGEAAAAPVLARVDEAALPQDVRARLAGLRTDAALRRLGFALKGGAPDALTLGEALRNEIEARRDGGTATALGWAALKAARPRDAIGWFETGRRLDPAQPGEGLARAYAAAGDTNAARRALAGAPGPRADALMREIGAAQIDAAYRRGAFAEVVARAARLPDPPIVLGWSLFRLRRFDAAASAFERRYREHRERAAAEGLVLSLMEAQRPEAAEAAAARYGGAVRTALAITPASGGPDLGYRLAVGRLRTALDRHDAAEAARLAETLAGTAVARQDSGVATTLGWAAFEQNNLEDAARWFALGARAATAEGRDDAEYGAALTAFRQGHAAAAEKAAAGHAAKGRWRLLRLDALMQRANRESEADPDSAAAAATAREVLRLDPARRDAEMLLAWSDVRSGHKTEGAAVFERLYRAKPDEASANGLATAADLARGQVLAAELGGPLQAAVQLRAGQDAFGRKAFLAAYRIDPRMDPALANLDAPSFRLDTAYRSKSGGTGTSRLESVTGDLAGTMVRGLDRVTMRVHLVRLDAGSAPPAAGPTVARMTTRLGLGAEPVIAWERQAIGAPLLSPFAEIGLTPIGGAVGPTVQGQFGVAWQAATISLRAMAFRQSITESVLSFTGVVDPVTGRRFGRVMETGGKIEGYVQLAERWGVYGQGMLGVRDGMHVQSNLHGAAAAALSYELKPAGFDTLTVGPSYQFAAFQKDLSGFTLGQGGYYSPSSSHTVGTALRFQTAESRDFMVRGSVFTGWQFAHSAGTNGGRATRQDGFNSVGEVVASYRLTPRWAVGGMFRYQVSPQYTDLYAGVALTLSLGDRARLLSADLPRFDSR